MDLATAVPSCFHRCLTPGPRRAPNPDPPQHQGPEDVWYRWSDGKLVGPWGNKPAFYDCVLNHLVTLGQRNLQKIRHEYERKVYLCGVR
ncbi:hypothetical protein J6590_036659 [Homalodisca vitripennis]|nr:hypothetical protein J6590_036659 [Homalodisca vitripennis]